jgi:hypothetical protein
MVLPSSAVGLVSSAVKLLPTNSFRSPVHLEPALAVAADVVAPSQRIIDRKRQFRTTVGADLLSFAGEKSREDAFATEQRE